MFEKLAEARIDEAIASGELVPPPGQSGPLDLDAYFATPVEWRSTFALLKSHGFTPPEVEAMNRVAALEEKLAAATDPAVRSRLSLELQACRTSFTLALERVRRK